MCLALAELPHGHRAEAHLIVRAVGPHDVGRLELRVTERTIPGAFDANPVTGLDDDLVGRVVVELPAELPARDVEQNALVGRVRVERQAERVAQLVLMAENRNDLTVRADRVVATGRGDSVDEVDR